MEVLANSAPQRDPFHVYFVGGATAVDLGWRASTIDVDLYAADDRVFSAIQKIKEDLRLNIEFARPEDFVPALAATSSRHLFIDNIGRVDFYHYDPYAQLLSKLVRGFRKDLEDAESFLSQGLVDAERFRSLVVDVPAAAYAKYPNLSRRTVCEAVEEFLSQRKSSR